MTGLNKATVLKLDRLPDILEPRLLISLNMVVCHNNQDLSQPDRWLTNSLQASFLVNKVAMALHQPSLQVNIKIRRWVMEDLPVLEAMAVVSRLRMHNGAPLQLKALETGLVATRDNRTLQTAENLIGMYLLWLRCLLSGEGYTVGAWFLSFCICVSLVTGIG